MLKSLICCKVFNIHMAPIPYMKCRAATNLYERPFTEDRVAVVMVVVVLLVVALYHVLLPKRVELHELSWFPTRVGF